MDYGRSVSKEVRTVLDVVWISIRVNLSRFVLDHFIGT